MGDKDKHKLRLAHSYQIGIKLTKKYLAASALISTYFKEKVCRDTSRLTTLVCVYLLAPNHPDLFTIKFCACFLF